MVIKVQNDIQMPDVKVTMLEINVKNEIQMPEINVKNETQMPEVHVKNKNQLANVALQHHIPEDP